MLLELTGCSQPIRSAPRSQATLVRNRIGSPMRAEQEIGFPAAIGLRDGLERLIAWRAQHKAEVEARRRRRRAADVSARRTAPVSRVIQIAQPCTGEEEWQAMREPLTSGWLTQGPKVARSRRRSPRATASSTRSPPPAAPPACISCSPHSGSGPATR